MIVQLTIQKGKGAGQTLTFTQPEIKIGRTPENDIIVLDPGISRTHARLFERESQFFVEDLKSVNGTRVNGAVVREAVALGVGDTIVLGEEVVVFRFSVEVDRPMPPMFEEQTDVRPDFDSTVLKPMPALPAMGADAPEQHTVLKDVRALRRATVLADSSAPIDGNDEAYVRMTAPGKEQMPRLSRPEMAALATGGESAVEAYRRLRAERASLASNLRQRWLAASVRTRVLAVGMAAVVALVVGWAGSRPFTGRSLKVRAEPTMLTFTPVPDSFGLGEGVTWHRPDSKAFEFQLASATQAVAVIHFRSKDIEPGEVAISLNGVDQGEVPPDGVDPEKRELEQVLSPAELKRNAVNVVTFDSLHNPPGSNPWRIWDVWIEVIPLPDLPQEELLRLAQAEATKGRELNEVANVGPDNMFRAWKAYRTSWLMMEALTERPPLYDVVRGQMRILANQLDVRCGTLMLEAELAVQLKKKKRARAALEDVARFFPSREHRCQSMAFQKMDEYGL